MAAITSLRTPQPNDLAPLNRSELSPLELLVLQPSPFCNLNCAYCYIPEQERANTERMSLDVLEKIFKEVFASPLVSQPFTIAWHAGEPLALPIAFYEQAFEILERYNVNRVPIVHAFQSNGTLINEKWCDFFIRHQIHVGLSIDGPEFLHDMNRVKRNGAGTHKRAVTAVRLLNEKQIPFSVISVLTSAALEHPDEMFDFYLSEGINHVGFNIEEVEGPNQSSSMQLPDARRKFAKFLDRFYDLSRSPEGEAPKVSIREMDRLDDVFRGIKKGTIHLADFSATRSQEVAPFAILSFDYKGNFSTFSPELVGMKSDHYGDFSLGNILGTTIEEAVESLKFRMMWNDVRSGIEKCRESCSHFYFCGGGSASNKYYENGSFDSVETMACRLSKKLRIDVVKHKVGLATEEDVPSLLGVQTEATSGFAPLPMHLQEKWWSEVVPEFERSASLDTKAALESFGTAVLSSAAFRGLASDRVKLDVQAVIRDANVASNAQISGRSSALLNLGEKSATFSVKTDRSSQPVSLTLSPGTSYWLGHGEFASISETNASDEIEVLCLLQALEH